MKCSYPYLAYPISRSVLKERQRVSPAKNEGRRSRRGKIPLGDPINPALDPGLPDTSELSEPLLLAFTMVMAGEADDEDPSRISV